MFGLTHKFKLGQTQKLMAAALMLAVSPVWGELKWVYGEGNPICETIHDTIEETPDFWERFEKEGFHYVLTASPFKHYRVERIHPVVVLTAGLHNYLREKQEFMTYVFADKINKGAGSLKSLAYEIEISKEYFYEPLDRFDFGWGDGYKESFIYRYINRDEQICKNDCDELGNNFFAYRIKSNFYNRWDIDEYTIGIMDYGVSNRNQGQESEFHVVDKYMQPHHRVYSKGLRSYHMPSGYPLSTMAYYWNKTLFVPIYVNGRSYRADIRDQPFLDRFAFIVKKIGSSNDILCHFEFYKNN